MGWLDSIKQSFFNRRQSQELAQSAQVQRQPLRFDQTRTAGILFDGSHEPTEGLALGFAQWLEKQGKSVSLLAFVDADKPELVQKSYPFFCKKDLGWNNVPRPEKTEAFAKQPFDLLFNLYGGGCPALDYLSITSPARLRVGLYRPEAVDSCDLMWIAPDLAALVEKIRQELPKIQPK